MRFTIKNYLLEILRGILILTLVLQIISIFAHTFQLIRVDDNFEKRTYHSEQSHQMMTLSGNNSMMVLKSEKLTDSAYRSTISKKIFNYFSVQRIINSCFVFLVALQLSLIFKTFPSKIFQTTKNSIRVKYIALIILVWSITDFMIRFYPSKVIPDNLFYSSYGVNTFSPGSLTSYSNINLRFLLVALLIYILSIAFEHGSELQREANQTI